MVDIHLYMIGNSIISPDGGGYKAIPVTAAWKKLRCGEVVLGGTCAEGNAAENLLILGGPQHRHEFPADQKPEVKKK